MKNNNNRDSRIKKTIKFIIIIIIIIILFLGGIYIAQAGGVISLFSDIRYLPHSGEIITVQSNLYNDFDGVKTDPYIFEVRSYVEGTNMYRLIIDEDTVSDLSFDSFRYELTLNDKQLIIGNLDSIKEGILYEGNISNRQSHIFELKIWLHQENDIEDILEKTYKYKVYMEEL